MKGKLVGIFIDDILAISGILFFASKFIVFDNPITHFIVFGLLFISCFKFIIIGRINIRIYLFLLFIIYLAGTSILTYEADSFDKFLGFCIYSLSYYLYFYNNKNRLNEILKIYCFFSIVICFICLIQEVGYFLKNTYMYDFSIYGFYSRATPSGPFLRVYGFFAEPASMADILLIPLCYYLYVLFTKHKSGFNIFLTAIVVITAILTFSIIPYILLTFFVIYFACKINKLRFILIFPIAIVIMVSGIYTSDNLREKVGTLFYDREQLVTGTGASTYAIVSDALVNTTAFIEHPILGTGFFKYEENYINHIFKYFNIDDATAYKRIKYDAIMYFKIFSEMGAIGVVFIVLIFRRRREKRLFVNALFWGVMICMIRTGSYFSTINYFNIGFIFMLLDNYYVFEKDRNNMVCLVLKE